MFTNIICSSTLKYIPVYLLFLYLKTNESRINKTNNDLHRFFKIHPVQKNTEKWMFISYEFQ